MVPKFMAPNSTASSLSVRGMIRPVVPFAVGAALVVAAATLSSHPARSAGFDHEGLAIQALDGHIRPGYERFKNTTGALKSALAEACKAHDVKADGQVKAAFRSTVLAWSQVEHIKFGPVLEGNAYERIMFFPDRQKIGERQVAAILTKQDPTVLTVLELQQKSVAVQGLTALEAVLYAKPAESYLAEAPEAKFACNYASAIAGNIAGIANNIVAAWAKDGSFSALWLKTGEQNPIYKSSSGPTAELLTAFRAGISNTRDAKLLPSLGLKKTGPNGPLAPKSKPPFDLSGLGLATMIANTEGVLELFEKGGLAERLAVTEKDTAVLIKGELQGAIRIGREMEPAGTAAFNDKDASAKLATMREPLATAAAGNEQLANAAGMVMGFTADDGD